LIEAHPAILLELRGAGLMQGVKCRAANTEVTARLLEAGLLTVTAGDNVVRLVPPLTISPAQIDEALSMFDGVCRALAA
jgi:acetylornithine/N-succinyldiaminopimelate aminotransferase